MTRIAWIVAATVLVAGQAAAQETRGTIQGTVKDPQGGVVAAAIVVVTNADTNVPVTAKTDTVGVFRVPLLLPGNYSVSVEASGFKKAVRTGIVLQLSDVRDVEITLAVGAVTEHASVVAEAPLVDAARTDAGATLEERAVQDLPVMTNTVFTMIRYAPGVQAGGPPILLGPHSTREARTTTTAPASAAIAGRWTARPTTAMPASPRTCRAWNR